MTILKTIILSLTVFISMKAYSQKPAPQLTGSINLPSLIYLSDVSKNVKNPIGASLSARFFLSKKIAIDPSLRYDNFNYTPLDKRTGSYVQAKAGVTYFDNLYAKLVKKLVPFKNIESYTTAEAGAGWKLNNAMPGNTSCLAYSFGVGIKQSYLNRRFFGEASHNWVNLKIMNNETIWWIETRLTIGYYFNK